MIGALRVKEMQHNEVDFFSLFFLVCIWFFFILFFLLFCMFVYVVTLKCILEWLEVYIWHIIV